LECLTEKKSCLQTSTQLTCNIQYVLSDHAKQILKFCK